MSKKRDSNRRHTRKRDSLPDLVPKRSKKIHLTHGPPHDRITTFYMPNGITHINHYHARNYYTISDLFGEFPERFQNRNQARQAYFQLRRQQG